MILTLPLLEGTDGERKMSKSYDNTVGFNDPPAEMYGRTMSIPDEAMPEWFRLASGLSHDEREDGRRAVRENFTQQMVGLMGSPEAVQQWFSQIRAADGAGAARTRRRTAGSSAAMRKASSRNGSPLMWANTRNSIWE